jgi:tetratricopeptide (TPR) repeat protein
MYAQAIPLDDQMLLGNSLHAEAFHNRGFALEKIGKLQEALGNYARAITLKPYYSEAYCNRGNVLFSLNRCDHAIADYEKAILIRPDYAAAYNNKANALVSLKRYDEALSLLNRAITLSPGYAEAYNNSGYAYQKMAWHEEALKNFDQALKLDNRYAEAHNNRGHSLQKLSRFQEALASYQQAIDLKPNYAEAIWNRGLIRLLIGDMPGGWQDIEWRWARTNYQNYPAAKDCKKWNGETLTGRSMLVYVEQGFGDMFQFCRYLVPLIESGAEITFAAPQVIHRLLSTLSPKLNLQSNYFSADATDYHCTLFSLPAVFNTRLDNIPSLVPYLKAEPELVEKWRTKIGTKGFRIGISWQGNPAGDVDIGRSLPLAALAPLAAIPGVRLISIQVQNGLEQLRNLPPGMHVEVLEGFNEGADGFIDTAAVMQNLDLVLTTDSAPAHLAGALGVPVWTMLMEVPDWRWMMDRSDSPWYPTMRLFRQPGAGDWASVVNEVHEALIERLSDQTTQVP